MKKEKYYILDTNILIQSHRCVYGFDDNRVIVTSTTLQELDGLKNAIGETGFRAREAIRTIYEITNENNPTRLFSLPNGGTFYIESDGIKKESLPQGYSLEKPDNRILSAVASLKKENPDVDVILITNDIAMKLNAIACGVETQSYKNEQIDTEKEYTGRCEIEATPEIIDQFYKDSFLSNSYGLLQNEYILLKCGTQSALGVTKEDTIYLISERETPFDITPKNIGQRFALDALMAPVEEVPLVILKGPAGSAKTFLSLAAGLDIAFDNGGMEGYGCNQNHHGHKKNVCVCGPQKVMITRANVLSDADLGFLPGDLEEKMNPLVAPFFDNLESLLRGSHYEENEDLNGQMEDMRLSGILEIGSIAYMRGRSLTNTYLIIDEAQNATHGQILEIITRAGQGTKVVLCGDPDQIDNPKLDRKNNGLVFASEKMKGSAVCAQVTFFSSECVRSKLSIEAAARLTK